MELKAERVEQLSCGRCGQAISPAAHKPLSVIKCPRCRHRVVVPASFGDFLITGVLGQGAAGIVCKATDRRLHRQVAIKVLKTGDDATDLAEACTREARAMAALNHPHVVQVHNIDEHRGQPFIVMELLEGGSVEKVMLGKAAHERDALDIAIGVAEGLQAAAAAGLVHMDIKPSNILFDRQKNAKLIDFGVARYARRSSSEIVGTPYYVAPEVVRGKAADVQADIYSLGATLFHLLAGTAPFEGRNATEVITKRLRQSAPSLIDFRTDLSSETVRVVGRMLEANPAHRHASYAELIADLRRARDTLDVPEEQRVLGELASAVAAPAAPGAGLCATGSLPTARVATASRTIVNGGKRRVPVPVMIGGAAAVLVLAAVVATQFAGSKPAPVAPASQDAEVDEQVPEPTVFEPEPSWIASHQDWRVLEPARATSSAGATMQPQVDNSLLVSGPSKAGESYTIDVPLTGQFAASGLAIEAMADESLERFGPGRNDGLFILTEVQVLAGPDEQRLTKVALKNAQAEHSQQYFQAADVLDEDPRRGWGISPAIARHHVLTLETATALKQRGGMLRFVLTHHPDYLGSIGRVRLWAKPLEGTAVPKTGKSGKGGAGKKAAPKPAEPRPAADAAVHGPNNFPMLYLNTTLINQGRWYALDVRQVESTGGAKMTRLKDGSILVESGPIAEDDTYRILAVTKLRNITGFRLDLLPDDSLPQKGPGRAPAAGGAPGGAPGGAVKIASVTIEAAAGDGSGRMKVPLVTPAATVQGDAAGRAFDDDPATVWSNEGAIGKPATLTVRAASPVNFERETLLTFTIRHAGGLPAGRFVLAATTNNKPEQIKPAEIALQEPKYLSDFIPLTIQKATSAGGAEAEILPGGVVSIPGGSADDTYAIEATMNVPDATALRLEALVDEAAKPGPGKGDNGTLAIEEFTVEVTLRGKKAEPVNLAEPSTDLPNEAEHAARMMIDGNDKTYWSAKRRGEKRTIIFPFAEPVDGGGKKFTITIAQPAAMTRFRLMATASKDAKVLTAPKK